MSLVLGADLSMKRSALVLLDSSHMVRASETFPIAKGPKLNLRASGLFIRKLKAYNMANLVVIENNDHQVWYRPLMHSLLMACQLHNLPTLAATPSQIRKALLGKGNATKEQVRAWLESEHEIAFSDDEGMDLSDAAACAAYGIRSLK